MFLGTRRARRLRVAALLVSGPIVAAVPVYAGSLGVATALATPRVARLARTISLNETAHLHPTGKPTITLINEEGQASGTIRGTIFIHLHLTNNHGGVSAEVNIYPHGGSLSGYGSASYRVEGADAVFSGKLAITRGTGSYAHASAPALRFTGSIQRRTDAVSVQLSGPLSV
jgi:hypothetical protein